MSEPARKSAPLWRQIGCGLLMAAPILLLVWLPILNSDVKLSEVGETIPTAKPDEKRRVTSEAGFSIIAPPNWEVRRTETDMQSVIRCYPRQLVASRFRAGMSADRTATVGEIPEGTGADVEFAGRHASLVVTRTPSTIDDSALTSWSYSFVEDGATWSVSYFLAEDREEIPPAALRYLRTFRIE